MRVVVDTNVLVSALLVEGSVPDQVERLALAGRFTWIVDARIVAEYEDVLRRPRFAFDGGALDAILTVVRSRAEWVVADPLPLTLPDPSDLPFLEVAVAGGADAIVTGNPAHFRATEGRVRVHIVSPRSFLDTVGGRAQR